MCVLCLWGLMGSNVCLCVAVLSGLCFGLLGGVVCPLVWRGVLVLLWGYFVDCVFGVQCVFGTLWG